MISTPQIVITEALPMAKIYAKIPTKSIQQEMGKLVGELMGAVQSQGVEITGPWFTHHFQRPGEFFDFEVCVPVSSPVKKSGRMEPGAWPAMKVARTTYRGGYEGLPAAWGEFMAWTDANDLKLSSEIWERYTVNPNTETDPAKWETELNRPIL